MGARGPLKKSRKKAALEGQPSKRPRAPAPTMTGLILVAPPTRPTRLKGEAGVLWERLVPLLVRMRVLAVTDLEALSVLCDRWQEYLQAKDECHDNPYFETDKGYVSEHPSVRRMHAAASALMDLWSKFGLTPVSREQLDVASGSLLGADSAEGSDLDAFSASKNG